MSITIRPLQPEDYPATTEIYNAQNEPDHHLSDEELRRSDALAKEQRFYDVLSVVLDGEVIARGQVGERHDDDSSGKYWAWFFVREDHRGKGVDSALYDAARDLLADRDPRSLWTCIREDFVPAAAYLAERGYEEQFRSWGAHLDLARFDPRAFVRYRDALSEIGIGFRSYADLALDPGRDEKLAALQAELEEDAPHCEPIIPKRHPTPQDPSTILDSFVVAVLGDEYVGMASLTRAERSPRFAGSGLVGVRRAYRNQGIATALEAYTSAWAKERGYAEVNAGGAGVNAPMLRVIRRIGFDVEPAWITFAKFL